MTPRIPPGAGDGLPAQRLLLRLDLTRIAAAARYPDAGALAGVLIPLAGAAGVLWSVGRAARPGMAALGDAATLAMLVSAPIGYLAHGVLFRGRDATFLRLLGLPARAIYEERAVRLLSIALLVGLLALVPFAAAGAPLGRPAVVAAAAALAAWGLALAAAAGAGAGMARHQPGRDWGPLSAGMWDREVAAAAPLAYAPLVPFLGGTVVGMLSLGGGAGLLASPVVATAAAWTGARWHARALPRFGPQAQEFAFAPETDPTGGELRARRGVARLLPRPAAAAWARDGIVGPRRYPWAARVAWPVAIGAFFALARWGDDAATRGWVVAGVAMALLVQALATVSLGRAEAHGWRWLDRSLGIGSGARALGRWAWAWGMSMWLVIPVSLAWWWWSGEPGAWIGVPAAGALAALAAALSVGVAGWR